MSEELKKAIVELLEKNSAKGKKKIYPKDLAKTMEDNSNGQFKRADAKKVIQEMLDAGELAYWSSGSTTYVMLKKDFDELKEKEEG